MELTIVLWVSPNAWAQPLKAKLKVTLNPPGMILPGNNNLDSLAPDDSKKFMILYSHRVLYHIFRLHGMQLMTDSSTPPDVFTGIMT